MGRVCVFVGEREEIGWQGMCWVLCARVNLRILLRGPRRRRARTRLTTIATRVRGATRPRGDGLCGVVDHEACTETAVEMAPFNPEKESRAETTQPIFHAPINAIRSLLPSPSEISARAPKKAKATPCKKTGGGISRLRQSHIASGVVEFKS